MGHRGRASQAFANERVIAREMTVGDETGAPIELETFTFGTPTYHRVKKPELRKPRGWMEGNNAFYTMTLRDLLRKRGAQRSGRLRYQHGYQCRNPECCPGNSSEEQICAYARHVANRHSERAITKQNLNAARIKRSRGQAV